MTKAKTRMITKNFSEAEMRCPCNKCDGGKMDLEFMVRLQDARDYYGRPVAITSGMRCPEHNKEVGGKENSLHLFGMAADAKFYGIQDVYDYVQALMRAKIMKMGVMRIHAGLYMVHADKSNNKGLFVYE